MSNGDQRLSKVDVDRLIRGLDVSIASLQRGAKSKDVLPEVGKAYLTECELVKELQRRLLTWSVK